MIQIKALDSKVPMAEQIKTDELSIVLVNTFDVSQEDIPALLKAWESDANWMKKQPGYISTQLHQGIAGSTVFMNYAIWESVEHFRNAFSHPEFQESLNAYPSSTVASPHLFKKIAVANLCTGS